MGAKMVSLDMAGFYELDVETIDSTVTRTCCGNYGLGYIKDGDFYVKYVGRSDTDLKARLKNHIGNYKYFKYSYATSPKAAFEKECQNFHDFGETEKLDNKMHPDRPKDTNWKCPVCKIYG
jgi:hypothetical protein